MIGARWSATPWWMVVAGVLASVGGGCTVTGSSPDRSALMVVVTAVDDSPLPAPDAPLPPNLGDVEERWTFHAEAHDGSGAIDTSFNGFARVSIHPGAVDAVLGAGARGRNVQFVAGQADGEAVATAMFGPTRLWLEDIGYQPAEPGQTPRCANGLDDDGDVLDDFPNDPGCAFADDMSEEPGSLATGVSLPVAYRRPTLADLQGHGAQTPYPAVAVELEADAPSQLVVTRVASTGFYVSDLNEPSYGHLYAFNFNTPDGMRVCDRLSFLSGTATEFFGFTEVSFPSYEVALWVSGGAACANESDCAAGEFCRLGSCQPCPVPEPALIENATAAVEAEMEKLESALVRVEQVRIASNFGPGLATVTTPTPPYTFAFGPDASNCDLNGDGTVDYLDDLEGSCSNACSADPDCSDWLGYAARGNYKVSRSGLIIQINTGTAGRFEPLHHKGMTLAAVTGTLRNFSGGSLNWTVETRCAEDLVCNFDEACAAATVPSNQACFSPPTEADNDAATN